LREIEPPLVKGAKLYIKISDTGPDATLMDIDQFDENGDRKAESGFTGTFLSGGASAAAAVASSVQTSAVIEIAESPAKPKSTFDLPGIAYASEGSGNEAKGEES